MKLSAPKFLTFIIAVILAVLGVIFFLAKVSVVYDYAIWFVVAGFVLLGLGNLIKGL